MTVWTHQHSARYLWPIPWRIRVSGRSPDLDQKGENATGAKRLNVLSWCIYTTCRVYTSGILSYYLCRESYEDLTKHWTTKA